jgi:hypothetical protein
MEVYMKKTGKLLIIAAIAAAIVFVIAGCENQTMSSNETAYMNSDLDVKAVKVVWEAAGMNMHIYLEFDEPVRSDRGAASWQPFTVSFDYSGTNTNVTSPQIRNIDSSFTRVRGEEKTLHHFQWMWASGSASPDEFSNVRISYMAPAGTKIVGLSGAELKNFMDKPVTRKETGGDGGMGGM